MPDPNNVVMHKQRLVCMFVCKAGNTSVKKALADALAIPDVRGVPENLAPHRRLGLYLPSASQQDILGLKLAGFFVIGFCRHPFARLASCWRNKVDGHHFHAAFARKYGSLIRHHMPFEEFVEVVCHIPDSQSDQHFRSISWDLTTEGRFIPDNVYAVDSEGWWDKMRSDVSARAGIDLGEERRENLTGGGFGWHNLIDGRIAEMVRERYAEDFALFGYDPERMVA